METMRKTCKHLEHTVSLNSDSKQGIIKYGHPQYTANVLTSVGL